MRSELIDERDDLLIRRVVLEPGEATPWHVDHSRRFTVVVRGEELTIEFRDNVERHIVGVHPGLTGWDDPEDRVHRAHNTGAGPYEEVVLFLLDAPGADPQPVQDDNATRPA